MEELISIEYWSKIWEDIISWVVEKLPGLLFQIIILFIILKLVLFFINRLGKLAMKRATKNKNTDETETEKRIKTLIGILKGAVKVLIWASIAIIILKSLGVNVSAILAGAGVVGLAVGFGAQELVRDVISGFFILLENQVRTGDVAIINGTGGLVEKIELRTITLRDFSGVVHIFQNGKINSLSNMTKEWSAMVFDIGVAYKEDPEEVIQVMTQIGADLQNDEVFGPKIIEPIEVVGVNDFADSAVVIRARFKTKPIEQWNVGREYRKRLKKAFDERNIEIPFPHQTIYWGEKIGPLKMQMEEK